jgi:hypothetical protein
VSSEQIRYGITFGSGAKGRDLETKLRAAALREEKTFSQWILQTLAARAEAVLVEQKDAENNP